MTVEQEARDMLERIGVESAQSLSSGDLVELANLIHSLRVSQDLYVVARGRLSRARGLLIAAMDATPDYIDGRNDALCDAIVDWIDETQ